MVIALTVGVVVLFGASGWLWRRQEALNAKVFSLLHDHQRALDVVAVGRAPAQPTDLLIRFCDEHEREEIGQVWVGPKMRRPVLSFEGARYVAARYHADGSWTYRRELA